MNPLWTQFRTLLPPVIDAHPLGCHRPRAVDRVVFEKLVQVLVLGAGSGSACPPPRLVPVHLDAGYDSKKTRDLLADLGCAAGVATKGRPAPIQVGKRWVVERTNSWHTRGFRKLAICTEKRIKITEASIALTNAIITIRRLIIREA